MNCLFCTCFFFRTSEHLPIAIWENGMKKALQICSWPWLVIAGAGAIRHSKTYAMAHSSCGHAAQPGKWGWQRFEAWASQICMHDRGGLTVWTAMERQGSSEGHNTSSKKQWHGHSYPACDAWQLQHLRKWNDIHDWASMCTIKCTAQARTRWDVITALKKTWRSQKGGLP